MSETHMAGYTNWCYDGIHTSALCGVHVLPAEIVPEAPTCPVCVAYMASVLRQELQVRAAQMSKIDSPLLDLGGLIMSSPAARVGNTASIT